MTTTSTSTSTVPNIKMNANLLSDNKDNERGGGGVVQEEEELLTQGSSSNEDLNNVQNSTDMTTNTQHEEIDPNHLNNNQIDNNLDMTKVDSNSLRAPCFFRSHRRRSKTYSGEEFAQHLSEQQQQQQQKGNTTVQDDDAPKDLPNIMDKHFNKKNNDSLLSNRRWRNLYHFSI